jgi:ubiquinone/menaquinone biosynthesis C-methylase UbiE
MDWNPLERPARGLYYASFPALTVDAEGRVLDYNLALGVLAGDALNGRRYFPLEELVERLARRVTQGALVPAGGGVGPTKCIFDAEGLGSVHLVGTQTVCQDSPSGKPIGRIISWEILAGGEDWFHGKYRERLDDELTWDTYASSYDRVLNLMPYYRTAVGRHGEALAATSGPLIDLGGGTGNLAEILIGAGRTVTVVDDSRAMLDKLRSKSALATEIGKRLTVIEASAEHLPMIGDASFAGASILLALFAMRAPEHGLDTAVRILEPGGVIVVTDLKPSFQLDPILQECERHLKAIGRYEELAEDLKRVVKSNRTLAPGSLSSFRTESVLKSLEALGFRDLDVKDSHFGQCATITGRKPDRSINQRASA